MHVTGEMNYQTVTFKLYNTPTHLCMRTHTHTGWRDLQRIGRYIFSGGENYNPTTNVQDQLLLITGGA